MENLNQVDDMVCEYLLFRGFTNVLEQGWRIANRPSKPLRTIVKTTVHTDSM